MAGIPKIGAGVLDDAANSIGQYGTTPEELAQALWPAYFGQTPAKAIKRAAEVLGEMQDAGRVIPVGDRWQLVAETSEDEAEQAEAAEAAAANGAPKEPLFDPDEGREDDTDDSQTQPSTESKPMAKRGRKPGTKNKPKEGAAETNGAAAPAEPAKAAPSAAENRSKKGNLFTAEDSADHLAAIDRCETELSDAKIAYEDALNVRRLARARYDVAKSERRRFSAHEGSDLKQITAAQKAVDKAEKTFNEAQHDALEKKNAVANCESKLSRTIAGEMPLFDASEDGEE